MLSKRIRNVPESTTKVQPENTTKIQNKVLKNILNEPMIA
jgi:hypothetical protein